MDDKLQSTNITTRSIAQISSRETEMPVDPLEQAERWMLEGKDVAIATVISTWGSAPVPIGSCLVIDEDGNFEGSVSGGCVENEVIARAMDVIGDGVPKSLEFGVNDEIAWQVGLSCGGQIKIYLERVG